ncbi:MAG: ATP-dependent helicase, partial [Spirochaetes bacterium]|nr:ATP-dependent helicase [Spirochaetota bacterium]
HKQPLFEPLPLEALGQFFAFYQGIIHPGNHIIALQNRLDQLFGYPAQAGLWESDIFPVRLNPYYPAWLDSLMQSADLIWFGCGEKKVSFCFQEDLDFFQENKDDPKDETEDFLRTQPGKFSYFDLTTNSQYPKEEITKKLWQACWQGRLSNDTFIALRKAIQNNFVIDNKITETGNKRRVQFNRWQASKPLIGNWFILKSKQDGSDDTIALEENNKERVRILLARYGILFKELLNRELPLLNWSKLFKTLRIMELSGEILSGCFFEDIPGLQFISAEAFRLLGEKLPSHQIYWLNACDPASLCGLKLETLKGQLPSRIASNYLVYEDRRLLLDLRRTGKEVHIYCEDQDPALLEGLGVFRFMINREFEPAKRILVEKINDQPANQSPFLDTFLAFGFKKQYKGLELWKSF